MEAMIGPAREYVRQIGATEQCARQGCPVRHTAFRVILGHFHIQAYVCAAHVLWAVALDRLSQNTGERLGWEYGYGDQPHCRTLRSGATIIPEMPTIRRSSGKYTRDVSGQISGAYPQFDETGFAYFHPGPWETPKHFGED